MSSDDEDYLYDDDSDDSGNESTVNQDEDDDNDDFGMDIGLGEEASGSGGGGGGGLMMMVSGADKKGSDHAHPYEVLSTEQIVEHMVDCIKEVNSVIQIPTTTVRILLNHFKWDKEKLMERYFSDSQEQMLPRRRWSHLINWGPRPWWPPTWGARGQPFGQIHPGMRDCT
jgi:hypothetical protein